MLCIFLTKTCTSDPLSNVFHDLEIWDILQGDILGYIKRDIFNLLIRYPKYLKRSSTDYKERIDNLHQISEGKNIIESV